MNTQEDTIHVINITIDEIIENLLTNMKDMMLDDPNSFPSSGFVKELDAVFGFAKRPYEKIDREDFKSIFSSGSSMMLLSPDVVEFIENCDAKTQMFCVKVRNDLGEVLIVLNSDIIEY